jgi:lysophospholipase L1-like esterase
MSIMHPLIRSLFLPLAINGAAWTADIAQSPAQEAPDEPCIKLNKDGQPDGGFEWKTREFCKRGKAGPIGVMFIGDSITAGWDKVPELWQAEFGRWLPVNFGIGGDRTQHVLWRIEQGMLDGHPPHVVVLMIGTNNLGWKRPTTEIIRGQHAIIAQIHHRLPKARLIIMGLLPRGLDPAQAGTQQMRLAIAEINRELATLDDGNQTRFLDIGNAFVDPAGTVKPDLLPDGVHPNATGYQIWAAALRPILDDMMRDANIRVR